tara:strand:- start:6678 stop:8090 length:1413 start_codon:yes stop_codon:yes gene_type:complete
MTIKYLDSKRLSGVSGDTKPTNVQDNSIFVETNTDRRYWFQNKLTFQDNFSTDDWTTSSSSVIGVSNGLLNWSVPNGSVQEQQAYVDMLGSLINTTKWTLRFKLNVSGYTQGSSAHTQQLFFGISNENSSGHTNTQNIIGLKLTLTNTVNTIGVQMRNATPSNTGNTSNVSTALGTGTWYVEINRLNLTQSKITLYSDATYNTIVSTATETYSTNALNDLRYLKCSEYSANAATDHTLSGTIDDVEFFNGVPFGGALKQWFPTFQDNFRTDDWTDVGSGNQVNTSTNVIDWEGNGDNTNDQTAYDLGTGNVSDSAWVLRFKLTIDNLSRGSSASDNIIFVGIGDESQATGMTPAQDFIGISVNVDSSSETFYAIGITNGNIGNSSDTFTVTPSTKTYYIEIKRTSPTTADYNIYSDVYNTLTESETLTISSSLNGLKYIKVLDRDDTSAPDSTINGTIDDVEFFNGVTSA